MRNKHFLCEDCLRKASWGIAFKWGELTEAEKEYMRRLAIRLHKPPSSTRARKPNEPIMLTDLQIAEWRAGR